MTTIYSSVSVSGYNASPPADDGSAVSTNKITWSKHKTKLGDPLKTALETINTNASSAFGKIFHNATTAISVTTTLSDSDRGKTFTTTNSITVNLPAAATVGSNYVTTLINTDGGTITIDADGSETINGATTSTLNKAYSGGMYFCDGNQWFELKFGALSAGDIEPIANMKLIGNVSGGSASPSEVDILDEDDMVSDSNTALATQQSIKKYVDDEIAALPTGITLETPTTATGVSSHDFTSIPAGTKRIKVMLQGVSLNGTNNILIQIGDSGGIETSGYNSVAGNHSTGSTQIVTSTAGFVIRVASASLGVTGTYILDLLDSTNHTWIGSASLQYDGTSPQTASGSKSLSAELDRVRVTVTGANTFDATNINISYE